MITDRQTAYGSSVSLLSVQPIYAREIIKITILNVSHRHTIKAKVHYQSKTLIYLLTLFHDLETGMRILQ
jgi:hypothetical protein